jgi:hypothetical protein
LRQDVLLQVLRVLGQEVSLLEEELLCSLPEEFCSTRVCSLVRIQASGGYNGANRIFQWMVVIVRLSTQGLLYDAFDGRQVLTNFTRLHGVKPDIYAEGTHFNVRRT